jgi:proline dehydrogenase
MRILAGKFITRRDIREASRRTATQGSVRYSYDRLGEAARSAQDVERYFQAYRSAIAAIGEHHQPGRPLFEQPGVSVKLSVPPCALNMRSGNVFSGSWCRGFAPWSSRPRRSASV